MLGQHVGQAMVTIAGSSCQRLDGSSGYCRHMGHRRTRALIYGIRIRPQFACRSGSSAVGALCYHAARRMEGVRVGITCSVAATKRGGWVPDTAYVDGTTISSATASHPVLWVPVNLLCFESGHSCRMQPVHVHAHGAHDEGHSTAVAGNSDFPEPWSTMCLSLIHISEPTRPEPI
eukprot:1226398-Pyramimonas_sp.AAC.1